MSERHGDTGAETLREPVSVAPDEQLAATIDPVAEAERASFRSPREIVLLVMLLLVLLLVAVVTGRGLLIRPGAAGASGAAQPALPTRIPNGNVGGGAQVDSNGGSNVNAGGAPVCSPPGGPQVVSSRFRSYYDQYGGMATFGRPISAELVINGRPSQWFERALLEDWSSQTPNMIQGGLIGFQFTKGIPFPRQAPFVSQPGIRYFAETGHGVREPFLSFWEQRGGLSIFGYPISDEVQERLPGDTPGQTHTVQYFERARLELHPEQADAGQQLQIGLLGSALCLADSKPNITTLVRPTPVPVP